MVIEAIASAAAVALVGATFWTAREQVRASRSVAALQVTLRLLEEYEGQRLRDVRNRLVPMLLAQETKLPRELADPLLDFFEIVGHLTHRKLADTSLVWNNFSLPVICYWDGLEHYVRASRQEFADERIYEEVEWLYKSMLMDDTKRGTARSRGGPLTAAARRRFFESETT